MGHCPIGWFTVLAVPPGGSSIRWVLGFARTGGVERAGRCIIRATLLKKQCESRRGAHRVFYRDSRAEMWCGRVISDGQGHGASSRVQSQEAITFDTRDATALENCLHHHRRALAVEPLIPRNRRTQPVFTKTPARHDVALAVWSVDAQGTIETVKRALMSGVGFCSAKNWLGQADVARVRGKNLIEKNTLWAENHSSGDRRRRGRAKCPKCRCGANESHLRFSTRAFFRVYFSRAKPKAVFCC